MKSSSVNAGIIKESVLKSAVQRFNKYEDYLDSLISKEDLIYLEDLAFARRLVELGILNHSNSAIIPRVLFNSRKQEFINSMADICLSQSKTHKQITASEKRRLWSWSKTSTQRIAHGN